MELSDEGSVDDDAPAKPARQAPPPRQAAPPPMASSATDGLADGEYPIPGLTMPGAGSTQRDFAPGGCPAASAARARRGPPAATPTAWG